MRGVFFSEYNPNNFRLITLRNEADHTLADNPQKTGPHEPDVVGWLRVASRAWTPAEITETWQNIRRAETLCGTHTPAHWSSTTEIEVGISS